MWPRAEKSVTLIGVCALVALGFCGAALGHDPQTHREDGRVADAKNRLGGQCCRGDDFSLADAWERDVKGYRVQIDGRWYDVPESAYVTSVRNPYAEAIVWVFEHDGKISIRCFKEGVSI